MLFDGVLIIYCISWIYFITPGITTSVGADRRVRPFSGQTIIVQFIIFMQIQPHATDQLQYSTHPAWGE